MRSIFCALALMHLSTATCGADGAEPAAGTVQLSATMTSLLESEASGRAVDRRTDTGADAAAGDQWHSGKLLIADQWVPIDQIAYLEKSRQLKEYEALRGTNEVTAQQHRKLAHWCNLHRLPEQQRAHWYGAILSAPDDVEARKALGHESVGGRWYTLEELRSADEISKRTTAEWRRWMPVMRKLASDIVSHSRQKQEGLDRLAAIDDPSAVSSLEVVASQLSADQAIPFIRAIAKQRSPEACLALTRLALAFPTDPRGDHAISSLRNYPQEFYVPELLGMLSTPIESETETLFSSKGDLLIRRAMFREVKDEKQQLQLSRLVQVGAKTSAFDIEYSVNYGYMKTKASGTARGSRRHNEFRSYDIPDDQIAVAKNALEDQRQLDSQIASANAELERSARSVYVVLEKATGESVERSPQAWWNWWKQYNQRSSLGKSTRRYEFSQLDRSRAYTHSMHLHVRQYSCLAAGTLVHTADGPKAIENIRIGDMVVSQDVQSGMLALKPVLQTTVRPPKSTLGIVTDSGKIQATAGHRWFVAGKGWLMTRELGPDMLLHNATGTTRIVEVTEEAEEQETYNLIVDGFNTYFVGPEYLLSFDNSEPIPTLRAVPGFGQIAFD